MATVHLHPTDPKKVIVRDERDGSTRELAARPDRSDDATRRHFEKLADLVTALRGHADLAAEGMPPTTDDLRALAALASSLLPTDR